MLLALILALATGLKKLPTDVILVKGAVPSASDAVTPLPEGGSIAGNAYRNAYFGITWPLPPGWTKKYDGPPPSDSGMYVLAQLEPAPPATGVILITARDLFFAPPAGRLPDYYTIEHPDHDMQIAGRTFTRFDYLSEVAGLHWYTLSTRIRCHTVQFVFTGRDVKTLEALIGQMANMKFSDDAAPACVADYASNVVNKVDPALRDNRFNPIPARIVVGADGKVKHIHLLSAFPDQARIITDAVLQWTFKPYVRDGQAVEVETGVMFGNFRR
jgi:hypothetical protein